MGNKFLDCTALTIVIIGAINWGLIGFFQFDLVAFLFGNMSVVSRIIYDLVGICGLYLLSFYPLLRQKKSLGSIKNQAVSAANLRVRPFSAAAL